jgi:hypothetical protein
MMDYRNKATQKTATVFGILVGLAGIDHGIFEILQGNRVPDGLMIEAIGPAQRFWEHGVETALTVIPNFLISGTLSTIIGILVIIWASLYLDKKYGSGVLLLLSLTLFLVGGGFAPIFMTILASITATQIRSRLNFWRKVIPPEMRRIMAYFWPWLLIAFVFTFLVSVIIAVFGWPLTIFFNSETALIYLNNIAFVMLGVMLLTPLTGFARDIEKESSHDS